MKVLLVHGERRTTQRRHSSALRLGMWGSVHDGRAFVGGDHVLSLCQRCMMVQVMYASTGAVADRPLEAVDGEGLLDGYGEDRGRISYLLVIQQSSRKTKAGHRQCRWFVARCTGPRRRFSAMYKEFV